MKKTLYTNGDSWTAGDIVDPKLFKDQPWHVNHPDNKQYRLPRVWPHKLGKLANVDIINNSIAGASNDTIVRSTINDIIELKATHNLQEIFVIIGWSSPERKDFFYKWGNKKGEGNWECLYPAELTHWSSERKELNEFFKLYVKNHWYEEEYITRHCLNTITLHNFLTNLNIPHLFFNAFYEGKKEVLDPKTHQLYESSNLDSFISEFREQKDYKTLKRLQINNILKEYKDIFKQSFIKKSFIKFLFENLNKYKQKELIDYHPTELGHKLWANYIFENEFSKFSR